MNKEPKNKKDALRRFWKESGSNLLVGLIVSLLICVIAGVRGLLFSLPVWILIGLVCWLVRASWLFRRWQQDHSGDEKG